ncbi:DUF6008 family protein [Rhizobium sp. 2YAF20]|uniref:DUF6008 family protein n=1 Tax=Rhizobium sp. 2YAF20 TaxID=3233027 RepID=UPI003F9C7691
MLSDRNVFYLQTHATEQRHSALSLPYRILKPDTAIVWVTIFLSVAFLAFLFQIGHFAEHATQFGVWLLGDSSQICGRGTPWMSPWATKITEVLGSYFLPDEDRSRRMVVGMEIMHLCGNLIFLSGLISLWCFFPTRPNAWAIAFETFHLYEHIMLTASAYFIGKPIGMSTLFGGSFALGWPEFAVGFRVSWHFFMNALPMPFAMLAVLQIYRAYRERNSAEAEIGVLAS